MTIKRVATLKTIEHFRQHVASLGITLPADEAIDPAVWQQKLKVDQRVIGNRWCILPMEGWDGTKEGLPSDLTRRRWIHFGQSGAKLIWGGEAVAVRHDGRANPHQLWLHEGSRESIGDLRKALVDAHRESFGSADDLFIGLQLTHSGRYCRPNDEFRSEPMIAYRHPLLDRRLKLGVDHPPLSDDDLSRLVEDFVRCARWSHEAGFDFVDIKHCHGYLGHELLSAVDRPGRYGGPLHHRARWLHEVIQAIQADVPGLQIGVRLSAFDWIPFHPGPDQVGKPEEALVGYRYAFGGDGTGTGIDLTEVNELLDWLQSWGVRLVCVTAGSPYYVPHIQRPALFPPSDGYLPPEDPLVGCARQIEVTRRLKERHPEMIFIGSGYSYLQEWLPNVGQSVLRTGGVDFVGLGRMVLAYPEMPADVLAGRALERKRICRTFSDCTTGPRQGMVSGCFPLDPFYKTRPEAKVIEEIRKRRHEES